MRDPRSLLSRKILATLYGLMSEACSGSGARPKREGGISRIAAVYRRSVYRTRGGLPAATRDAICEYRKEGRRMSMFCPQDDPDRSRLERLLAEVRRIGSTETEGRRLYPLHDQRRRRIAGDRKSKRIVQPFRRSIICRKNGRPQQSDIGTLGIRPVPPTVIGALSINIGSARRPAKFDPLHAKAA
jgi:hypothetical protein